MRTFATIALLTLTLAACGDDGGTGVDDARTPDGSSPDAAATDAALPDAGLPDAAGPDAGPLACPDLDLHDCRLRADCAADLCPSCTCAPDVMGCRDVGDPAPECPQLDCPAQQCCDSGGDCPQGSCVAPGTPSGCGMCNPDPGDCATDGECIQGMVCEPMACACSGQRLCVPGCTVGPGDPCALGTTCDGAEHPRCQPSECDAVTPCPPDFDCDGGACARRTCLTDLDCDGWCVLGTCFDTYGQCEQPHP